MHAAAAHVRHVPRIGPLDLAVTERIDLARLRRHENSTAGRIAAVGRNRERIGTTSGQQSDALREKAPASAGSGIDPPFAQAFAQTDDERIGSRFGTDRQIDLPERGTAEIDENRFVAERPSYDGPVGPFLERIGGRGIVRQGGSRAECADGRPRLKRPVVGRADLPVIYGRRPQLPAVVFDRHAAVRSHVPTVPHIGAVAGEQFRRGGHQYAIGGLHHVPAVVLDLPAQHGPAARDLDELDRFRFRHVGQCRLRRTAADPHPVGMFDQIGRQSRGRPGTQRRQRPHNGEQYKNRQPVSFHIGTFGTTRTVPVST